MRTGIQQLVLSVVTCLVVLEAWRALSLSGQAMAQALGESGRRLDEVGQKVTLRAETLEFFQREDRLVATGQVVLESGAARMLADRLEVNTETGVGTATGQVRLLTPDDDVRASRLDFNLSAEQGLLYDAVGTVFGGYQIAGQQIERLGPKAYKVQRGVLTTCTQDTPDWAFRSREAHIGVGDYVTLKHPSFWIKGIPVFYLPYFIFPIKDQRTTGLLPPRVGYTSNDGATAQTAFYWAMADWVDATVGARVFSKRGIMPEVELRYAVDPLSDGRLQGAVIEDRETDDTLWRVFLQQRQEFGWGLRGLTQIDLRSDRDIVRRFSGDIRRESQVRTVSFGDLTKRFHHSVVTVAGASFDGIPEGGSTQQFRRLPTLQFNHLPTVLLGFAFVELDASYTRFSATDVVQDETVQRLDLFPRLTLPVPLAPWLNVAFTGGVRGTFYDRRIDSSSSKTREVPEFRTHVEGPSLRRRYTVDGPHRAFTHVIATRLDYRYVPRVTQRDLPAFEALDDELHFIDPLEAVTLVDRIEAANYAKASIVNRVFALGTWGAAPGQMREVARLVLSQGFDIRQATVKDGQLWGPLDVEIELFLFQRLTLMSDLRVAASDGDLDASSARLRIAVAPGWSLVVGHNYRQQPDVQYVSGGIRAAFQERLRLGYTVRYDGLSGVVREHRWSLQFLADCWQVDMQLRIRDTEDAPFFSSTSFFIRFNLFHF